MNPQQHTPPLSQGFSKKPVKKLRVDLPDFPTLVQSDEYFFFDHSGALATFLKHSRSVHLLTCPRRFGKTTLCRMIAEFCDRERAGENALFKNLNVANGPQGEAFLARHMHQYPLIHLSFKDTFGSTFSDFTASLKVMIQRVVMQHPAFQHPNVSSHQKHFLNQCRDHGLSGVALEDVLESLLECLYEHYGQQRVILVLDEYDKPFHKTFQQNKAAHDRIVSFMERFLGRALKDNPCLDRAFLTGVLRVSLNSLFSGLNNAAIFTVTDIDNPYQSFLGFPPEVVRQLITELGLSEDLFDAITTWYDGYCIGATSHRYNPWSVMSCLSEGGALRPHWVRSGDTQLLEHAIVSQQDPRIYRQWMALLSHQAQRVLPATHFTFDELTHRRAAVWSLLLQSGYVTAVEPSDTNMILVRIPNREVWLCFKDMVEHWLGEEGMAQLPSLVHHLITGDVEAFGSALEAYLRAAACYRDFNTQTSERLYHVLMLGVLIHAQDVFQIQSEPSSGFGHPDLVLIPKDPSQAEVCPTYIIEIKRSNQADELQNVAHVACQQIISKDYAGRYASTSTQVIGIGLAFFRHHMAFECVSVGPFHRKK